MTAIATTALKMRDDRRMAETLHVSHPTGQEIIDPGACAGRWKLEAGSWRLAAEADTYV
jgi:hypothetical protein